MKITNFAFIHLALVSCVLATCLPTLANKNPFKIQLASQYQKHSDVRDYWVSEKLDGIRGYWDGKHLYTRRGNKINTPTFFTVNWPTQPLEGELWITRNAFAQVSSAIRQKVPNNKQWQQIKFMLFDLPTHHGTFSERIESMKKLVITTNNQHLAMINQIKLDNNKLLESLLTRTVANGGEGLMLHKTDALYRAGRTKNIVKLKPFQDAEAKVIAHIKGKGKYQGKLGAIRVETETGITFKIGSGFTDKQRNNPPPIGSIITYKYSGKTHKGVPKFASFLRVRHFNQKVY